MDSADEVFIYIMMIILGIVLVFALYLYLYPTAIDFFNNPDKKNSSYPVE